MRTLLILCAMLPGCATVGGAFSEATMVKETKDGGRVQTYGFQGVLTSGPAIENAKAKMASKCPSGYDIAEEGLKGSEKYFDFKCK